MDYKTSHKTQYVSVTKVLKALETLRELGHPYYQFVPDIEKFKNKCKETDADGFKLLFLDGSEEYEDRDSESNPEKVPPSLTDDDEEEDGSEVFEDRDSESNPEKVPPSLTDDEEEEEYQKKDCVRKWQFDYNRNTCFSDNYPEINYKEDMSNELSVAPGEGKTPTDILREVDWDIKSYPCLHPDGKNSLQCERPVKLSEQDYFTQRILNKDTRFADSLGYVFAGMAYIEKKQIERNKGISFLKGKKHKQCDGTYTYTLDDPYSVLNDIKNTPRYWQKTRNELISRLENEGPFNLFFTLSCGDQRWPENFTALLQDEKIRYEYEGGQDKVFVNDVPLEEYLQLHESKSELIRHNLLNATLTFNHRVKMFIKNIVMSKGSPLSVKYYSYKVEFALRGAAHIHGVLWLDWDKIDGLSKEEISLIKEALRKIKEEKVLSDPEKEAVVSFVDLFISCSLKNPRIENIVRAVNMHHHTKACRKYGSKCRFFFPRFPTLRTIVAAPIKMSESSPDIQKKKLSDSKKILDKVKAVLENESEMEVLCAINAEELQEYMTIKELIQKVALLLEENSNIKKDGMVLVTDALIIKSLFDSQSKEVQAMKQTLEEFLSGMNEKLENLNLKSLMKNRIIALLKKAGISGETEKDMISNYEKALSVSENGYRVILERDIDEIFVNNYNSEWILNWNANLDIQICLDFFAIVTYICDYYSKDDSGTMKFIREALREARNETLKTKLSLVVNQFLTHRQIGETEAYFRILPYLHMKDSNLETVFVATGFKDNRSRFLQKVSEDELHRCQDPIEVTGRNGFYMEKPSVIEKYMRRDCSEYEEVSDISYMQFCKRYCATNTEPNNEKAFKPQDYTKTEGDNLSNLDFIITHDFEKRKCLKKLPKYIKIKDLQPGELKYMKLRKSYVARLHKFNKTKNPHEFYYSELQLYKPFKEESELYPNNLDKCMQLYDEVSVHNNVRKITNVKKILMEHLEIVDEGTDRAREVIESNAGIIMDNAQEQDDEDCRDEGAIEHEDFLLRNPEFLDNNQLKETSGNLYKKVELYSAEKIEALTLQLDDDQRIVVDICVNFAKYIVKARKVKMNVLPSPLVVVQGGAGCGKSTVIDVMCQQVEKILRTSGDNPNCPYIIRAAFTGTAAANIQGQTMHSAFSFNFGNEYLSLGDKSRDERRTLLENLKVVIIDEYSMIKADMLYQLDLRLKELKQRSDLPFGGVSIFLFGDILQLRPVRARYIFEEPICESFQLSHHIDPLWKKFDVVMLRTNHRQGEDKAYADILNRLRVGVIQQEDMDCLSERVRPLNHPDIPDEALVITCKNEAVNKINERKLAKIDDQEFVSEAQVKTQTSRNINPITDASGAIRNTPLQKILKLKIGARIMLTHNIDTCDSLTNGTFGEVIGLEFDAMNSLTRVIVCFDNQLSGKERRKNFVQLQKLYHPRLATPIDKIEFHYSLSRKPTSTSSNAVALQYPLRLAFAATAHKIQGSTIKKPLYLVIDLRTVIEAAQAYVMLSRVQTLSQLFILEDVSAKKIYASSIALEELNKMDVMAINNRRSRKFVTSCNIKSLNCHYRDFLTTPSISTTDVICLQETWTTSNSQEFDIPGFDKHYNNGGRGKGIATFYRKKYQFIADIKQTLYQITKVSSESTDVLNVYQSAGASISSMINDISDMIDPSKETVVVGDFNLCFFSERKNPLIHFFEKKGFSQLVDCPTHVDGRLLDHVYHYSPDRTLEASLIVEQQSVYYTDHDILWISHVLYI